MKIGYITVALLAMTTPVANASILQWGFDYTSGTVASCDSGVVADDSGNNHTAIVKFNTPSYSANIPTNTQNVTGIGSLDVTGCHWMSLAGITQLPHLS